MDGGRREGGITGPTLMLCARNSLLYFLCASHRVQMHYHSLQIVVYVSCVYVASFFRMTTKTCGGGGDEVRTGT